MIRYTLAHVMRAGGYGDRILAQAHDWSLPWYVDYHTPERVYFNAGFRAPVGQVSIPPRVAAWAAMQPTGILVEPHVKGTFSANNKDWGWHNWQALVARGEFVQCAPPDKAFLPGVTGIVTPTFLHACAVLQRSRGIVTTSGGLHIAAAALGVPAVVIWGAFSDPAVLGYTWHRNLYEPDSDGLGQRRSNAACRAAMERIAPDRVAAEIEATFGVRLRAP